MYKIPIEYMGDKSGLAHTSGRYEHSITSIGNIILNCFGFRVSVAEKPVSVVVGSNNEWIRL